MSRSLWRIVHPSVWSSKNPLVCAWDFYRENELGLTIGFLYGIFAGAVLMVVMFEVMR
jgi:hypothetical protein